MTKTSADELLQQAKGAAQGKLGTARGYLKNSHVHVGLLFKDMRDALYPAIEYWLRRNGQAPGPDQYEQETHFFRLAPQELQDEYLRIVGSITGLADDLFDHIEPGTENVSLVAPSLAPWRRLAERWLDDADMLVRLLSGPAAPAPRGAKRISRGALHGHFEGLMPCLVLATIGGHTKRWADGGDTPGLFNFGNDGEKCGVSFVYSGLLLPLAFCYDPDIKEKLYRLANLLRARPTKQRHELQNWLDQQGLGFLQLVDDMSLGGWTCFVLSRELFPRLLQQCDYVTALLDGPGEPVQILEREPFRWASHGDLLDWRMGENPEFAPGLFRLYLACDVQGIARSMWKTTERPSLSRPNAYWEAFTRPEPDVAVARVAVHFNQEDDDYGWVKMEIALGEQSCIVTLSDVYDPFPSLLDWLLAVAAGDLPIEVLIDEEGEEARLIVHALDGERVIFAILEKWEKTLRAAAVVNRDNLLEVFRTELRYFLRHGLRSDLWRRREDETSYAERLLDHPFLSSAL